MKASELGIGELRQLSWVELERAISEEETPLIKELAELEEQPLPHSKRVERKQEIRDRRADLASIRAAWRHLHKRSGGPTQSIEAGNVRKGRVQRGELREEG